MKIWLRSLAVLVPLATLASCTEVKAPPPPDAPRIERFEAAARMINVGDSVMLSFATVGATQVSMVDDQGQAISLEGTVSEGSTVVSPLRTTFYVLRASGPGGVTSTFLQIAVNEPLREAFLVAVPPELEAGEHAQLLWSAPGASSVTLTERGEMPQVLAGSSGLVPITPSASTSYRLTAQGAPGTPPVEALAEVRVKPVIVSFDFTAANGVRVGEPITFSWVARAAAALTISERTLGQLTVVSSPAQIAAGSFSFTVPATTPAGHVIGDGFPLRFTLKAVSGEANATREIQTAVGNLPTFENVTAPDSVSAGRSFSLSWRTLNASRVTIELGGLPIFETTASAPGRAANGSVTLPSPAADADYMLIASDERGQSVRRTVRVRVVLIPTITSFTVPATLSNPGALGTAQWETANATRVTLRLERGPTLVRVTAPASVRMGSNQFQLGSTARLTLEATNAAGFVASESRLVRVLGGAGSVFPQPALRNTTSTVTVDWQLSSLGVTETVGLPTTSADGGVDEVVNPSAFIDISASPTATEISFADPDDGSELITPADGFSFPLAGQLQRDLWVSANGFISFGTKPATLQTNADLGASSNATISMLAPFWDDVIVPTTGKVLYELQTSPTNERFLIVQWDNVSRWEDGSAELTFQAHLYETGRVTFAYKKLVNTNTSFTVGVRVVDEAVRQRLVYNGTGGPLRVDHELNFFTGGAPNGTLLAPTSTSRRINFFGRTPTGLLPFSLDVRTVAVGDLVVTEAMPFPAVPAAATGQWVEIRNALDAPVDLDGITVVSNGSDGGASLPPRVLLPGEYFLLGQTTDVLSSGGAPVQFVMNDVPLAVSDNVRFLVQGSPIASLGWDGGVLGESIFVPEGILTATGVTVTCPRTQNFGPDNAFGTPGTTNEACSPYIVSRVDAGYVEPGTGAVEVLPLVSDTGVGLVVLPAPFTYFGQTFNTVNLSLGGGFLSFGATLTSAYTSNPTIPATTTPNGVVAPFWDIIVRNSGQYGNGAALMERLSDRSIITWKDFRISSDYSSHLSFQVHLFDSGAIEFHYGSLETTNTSATYIPRPRGSSATIWLEHPNGTYAVPFSVNQLRVTSFMDGVRFTPAP